MISSTFIKGIQDIMRQDEGVDGDAQRLSQMVWMIFLKIFDDKDKELETLDPKYVGIIPEPLRWRDWAEDAEGLTGNALLDFINNKLFTALKVIPITKKNLRTQIVRGVFEDTHNYMKSGTLLRQVINKINEINFNTAHDRHIFNDLYEKLLKDLQSAGNSGEYYTPRAVTQFITEMVNPQIGESIFDPACGTGGFLANAISHLRKQVKTPEQEREIQNQIHGVEKKQLPHVLCVTNMIVHDVEVPSAIIRGNTLTKSLKSYGPSDRHDVILTNPPFGGTEEPGVENNFPTAFRTRETADLFLVLLIKLLKDGGRAGLVLPDGTLFGEGVKTRIKEELLNECDLHTIVRLPTSVFSPYTSIATNLLFFTKGKPTKEIWYYEHQIPKGQKAYNKTKPINIKEFDPIKEWWGNREESDVAWRVTRDQIEMRNYNLDFKNPNKVSAEEISPDILLKQYRDSQAELATIVNDVTKILKEALEHHDS